MPCFKIYRRRHHCRFCGRITCSKCCHQKLKHPKTGTDELICSSGYRLQQQKHNRAAGKPAAAAAKKPARATGKPAAAVQNKETAGVRKRRQPESVATDQRPSKRRATSPQKEQSSSSAASSSSVQSADSYSISISD